MSKANGLLASKMSILSTENNTIYEDQPLLIDELPNKKGYS